MHRDCNQATPEKLSLFKHALLLFKLYNTNLPKLDWIALNFQQVNSARQDKFQIVKNNSYKVGNNIITNRLYCLNNLIQLVDLNDSLATFKIKCKKSLL